MQHIKKEIKKEIKKDRPKAVKEGRKRMRGLSPSVN
jgi:hypothetical protein